MVDSGGTAITLLGGIEVSTTDTLPSRSVLLLAYLITRPGSVQPRSHLAALLWPESRDTQARTNLRRELHHLRQTLDHTGCLRANGSGVAWVDGPGCTVDVRTFDSACARAAEALERHDPAEFAATAERALSAYSGPFLPGRYEDWVLEQREVLAQRCASLCRRGARFWAERGDLTAAVAMAQRVVRLAPLDEPGYRELIRLQHAAGDRAGAMRTYHRCVAQLEDHLGVAPAAATQRQFEQLLGESVPGGASSRRNAPHSAPRRPKQPIGREREQRRLREAWKAARYRAGLLVVSGEPGIGKTQLVADLAATVAAHDGVVATARCFPATSALPMAPVAQWLRTPHLRRARRRVDPVWRAEADRLVPDSSGGAEDHSGGGDGARAKVDAWQRLPFFEGLARTVLAVDRPILLTVEDLQWCDRPTLTWLSFLLSFAPQAPLLIVATARTQELGRSRLAGPLGDLTASGQARVLPLGPLSCAATSALAEQVRGRPVTGEELTMLYSATDGNPMYVLEATRESVPGAGALRRADLRRVLGARLAQLPADSLHVAELASAVGRDFALDLLTEASDLDADAVVHAVDDLWRRRILVQRDEEYDFAHDLLREAVIDRIPPATRWLLHRRLAQSLELLYAGGTDVVAIHLAEQYDHSNQPSRAVPFYLRAAEQAMSVFAHREAVRLLYRCLALLDRTPAGRDRDRRRLDALQHLSPPLNASHGYAAAELQTTLRQAEQIATGLGMVPEQIASLVGLWANSFVRGDLPRSYDLAKRALRLCAASPEAAGQAHFAVAGSACSLGDLTAADRHFALATQLSGGSDSLQVGTRTSVHAGAWWAHARWLLGAPDAEVVQMADRAIGDARATDHPYTLAVALGYAAITQHLRRDPVAIVPVLQELTDLCGRYEFAYYREWAMILRGWVEGGRSGLDLAREGVRNLRRNNSFARAPYWLACVAELQTAVGDGAAAAATLGGAVAAAAQFEDRFWLPEVLRLSASLQPPHEAERTLRRAVAIADGQGSRNLSLRCRLDRASLGSSVAPAVGASGT